MSQFDKSPSDQIRIIRTQAEVNQGILLIQAVTRSILAVAVVVAGAYLLISQIPVPESAIAIAVMILGAYFGVEGAAAFLKRNGGTRSR